MKKFFLSRYNLTHTQMLTITGVLSALAVIMGMLKIRMAFFTVSFLYLPCVIGGIIVGPLYALAIGFTGDLLGTMISYGFSVSPLILLGNSLIGFIAGCCFAAPGKNSYVKIVVTFLLVLFIVTLGTNTLAWTQPPMSIAATYSIALIRRLPTQPPVVAINLFLCIICYSVLNQKYLSTLTLKTNNAPLPENKLIQSRD